MRVGYPIRFSQSAFLLIASCSAMVPHLYWDVRVTRATPQNRGTSLSMYFDDCERRDVEIWEGFKQDKSTPWIMSRSEEKRLAIENLLGYSPESAENLSDEKVEDETLHWAIDTRVLGEEDDVCKYDSISDLIVAFSCKTSTESLALLWHHLARLLDLQERNSVYLVVFPKANDLWEYDNMVLMLQAIQVSKALFPPDSDVQLDLFHPDYKHSPKMWSPETHAPFPTVGIQVTRRKEDDSEDIDATLSKLNALFDSIDAVHGVQSEDQATAEQVLEACQKWVRTRSHALLSDTSVATLEWAVQPRKEPYQLYSTLWEKISHMKEPGSSTMVVAPNLDAHTTHRIAVTVNAALRRLNTPVRISHVFHPNNNIESRKAPHPMIHLVYTA